MTRLTKAQQAERGEAIERLRTMLPPGSTVYTSLTHVSRSGMTRGIKVIIDGADGPWDASYLVARSMDYFPIDQRHGGVKTEGCGMDMGFHVVYSLSHTLYPNGFDCIGDSKEWGKGCPSNDHVNERGVRNYSKRRHHESGGYALRHRWL